MEGKFCVGSQMNSPSQLWRENFVSPKIFSPWEEETHVFAYTCDAIVSTCTCCQGQSTKGTCTIGLPPHCMYLTPPKIVVDILLNVSVIIRARVKVRTNIEPCTVEVTCQKVDKDPASSLLLSSNQWQPKLVQRTTIGKDLVSLLSRHNAHYFHSGNILLFTYGVRARERS